MDRIPQLFDRAALLRNRQRAASAHEPALFLHHHAADEIEERLGLVNRTFTAPAVVTPFADVWRGRLDRARIVADDDTLGLVPGSHDLVVHAMCLHWANDPVGQLVQARRALRPDGLFLGVLFGGRTLGALREALTIAETDITGGLSPRVAPMAEIRDLGALLQRAGFALPVADSVDVTVSYAGLRELMHDLRAMGETNALATRHRAIPLRRLFDTAAAHYVERHGTPDGRIPAVFEMVFLTGWAPDPSQPKPLRPGSADARLADALGVPETPLAQDPQGGD